jgi:hypothetical protein
MEDSTMKTELDEWVEFTLASIQEQLAQLARDDAAFSRFMQKVLGPLD